MAAVSSNLECRGKSMAMKHRTCVVCRNPVMSKLRLRLWITSNGLDFHLSSYVPCGEMRKEDEPSVRPVLVHVLVGRKRYRRNTRHQGRNDPITSLTAASTRPHWLTEKKATSRRYTRKTHAADFAPTSVTLTPQYSMQDRKSGLPSCTPCESP